MGKKLNTALQVLLAALGEYAFPGGKPTLDLSGTTPCEVTVSCGTHVTSSGTTSNLNIGDALTIQLGTDNNLYVVDPDSVEVMMGSADVTSIVYDPDTDTIDIACLTGDVTITADAMTYVSTNLAFHLDCKNRGGQSGHWIDRIGGVDFALTDVSASDNGMVFNGSTSKALVMDDNDPTQPAARGSKYLNVDAYAGTIEIIAVANNLPADTNTWLPIFNNPLENGIIADFQYGNTAGYANKVIMKFILTNNGTLNEKYAFWYKGGTTIAVSVAAHRTDASQCRLCVNGQMVTDTSWYDTYIGGPNQQLFAVGYYNRINNSNVLTEKFLNGTIKAIRVYNTKLTEQQMIQNYKVDKKRFNLQ